MIIVKIEIYLSLTDIRENIVDNCKNINIYVIDRYQRILWIIVKIQTYLSLTDIRENTVDNCENRNLFVIDRYQREYC